MRALRLFLLPNLYASSFVTRPSSPLAVQGSKSAVASVTINGISSHALLPNATESSPSLLPDALDLPSESSQGMGMILPSDIEDQSFHEAASLLRRVHVPVPPMVTPHGSVEVSYIYWPANEPLDQKSKGKLPILLVHGFDCSAFEFRYLGPLLAKAGHPTYAVDILGWGSAERSNTTKFSAQAKVETLVSFWKNILGADQELCIVGASLGACLVVEIIDQMQKELGVKAVKDFPAKAAVFLSGHTVLADGSFMKHFPMFWIQLCVKLLGIPLLRKFVEVLARFDKSSDAVEDSIKVWNFQRHKKGWEEALASYMKSGGFSSVSKLPQLESLGLPTLLVMGTKDVLLKVGPAPKMLKQVLNKCSRELWVDDCGHFTHLEKPEETASEIISFLGSLGELEHRASEVVTKEKLDPT